MGYVHVTSTSASLERTTRRMMLMMQTLEQQLASVCLCEMRAVKQVAVTVVCDRGTLKGFKAEETLPMRFFGPQSTFRSSTGENRDFSWLHACCVVDLQSCTYENAGQYSFL